MVGPALMPDAYSVSIWRQLAIDVEDMEKELLMEFDIATRFYFLNV
jgi:kinesin family member 2/24